MGIARSNYRAMRKSLIIRHFWGPPRKPLVFKVIEHNTSQNLMFCVIIIMKICKVCKKEKELIAFRALRDRHGQVHDNWRNSICLECEKEFEKLVKASDIPPECPYCGTMNTNKKEVQKFGFELKGVGVYKNSTQ